MKDDSSVDSKPLNYLTVDVEDYFQVSAFESISSVESWESRESRVERNTDEVLALLVDSNVKATFFILGWVAERFPRLTRRIAEQGHEVASHGYWHRRVSLQDRGTYRDDIRRSKALIEDQSGKAVIGYRAPSYSIKPQTYWAFDELLEAGYLYDSSIFPIKHDFYGISDWPRFAGYAVKDEKGWQSCHEPGPASSIREIPITTLQLAGKNLPIAGGGYFRLLPYALTRWGLRQINRRERRPFVFYLHPWEFDVHQPRMQGCSAKSRFRHYLNLHKTRPRFERLLGDFRFTTLRDEFFPDHPD